MSKRKWCVVSHDDIVNEISPISNETHENPYVSSAAPIFLRLRFSAPYLKGKPTQFKGKVKARITMLNASINSPSPAPVPKTAVVVWTQRMNLKKNAQWRNEKSYKEGTCERKKAVAKEETKIFASLAAGKIKIQRRSRSTSTRWTVGTTWTVKTQVGGTDHQASRCVRRD